MLRMAYTEKKKWIDWLKTFEKLLEVKKSSNVQNQTWNTTRK